MTSGLTVGPTRLMIITDMNATSDYNATNVCTATFSGVTWHMQQFGAERVWKMGTDDEHRINQPSGTLNVLEILKWMEQHGYLPANSVLACRQLRL